MPRPYLGPQLWLDSARGTYTIVDGRKRTRTGFTDVEHDKACEALLAYAGGVERPAARPEPVRAYKASPRRGVYVVGFDSYIKIGITVNIDDRLSQLQTPVPVKLYALLDGWRREELVLHQRFARYRLRGEWFHLYGELAEWIDGGCK